MGESNVARWIGLGAVWGVMFAAWIAPVWAQLDKTTENTRGAAVDDAKAMPAYSSLPRQLRRSLEDEIVPAMQERNDVFFVERFGKLLRSSDPQRLALIERVAQVKGFPSLIGHYVDLRLLRIEQGIDEVDEPWHLQEAMVVTTGINRRLEEMLDRIEQHRAFQDPSQVPLDWKASRDLFWELHVLRNELANTGRLVEFGNSILVPLVKRIRRSDDDFTTGVAQRFDDLARRWPDLGHKVYQREGELRLIRFNRAYQTLLASNDFRTKFIAAMQVELDSQALFSVLSDPSWRPATNSALATPGLVDEIDEQLVNARTLESDITQKAFLFRSGSHWWLRGRYGQSSLAKGLLKPVSAMKSEAAMNALYMPRVRIQPGEEASENDYYQRRHYYTWSVEYRPILRATSRENTQTVSTTKVGETTTTFSNSKFFY